MIMDGQWAVGEAELLLREFSHRTMNEVASALAALHLVVHARSPKGRRLLLDSAVDRLEALADFHRLLAAPLGGPVDVGPLVEKLVCGLCRAREGVGRSKVTLDLPPLRIEAVVARRVALFAAELVTNALRHAIAGRVGHMMVSVRALDSRELLLSVSDDGPGLRPGAGGVGTGWGHGIISELIRGAGGTLKIDTGGSGTTVIVVLPLSNRGFAVDDADEF